MATGLDMAVPDSDSSGPSSINRRPPIEQLAGCAEWEVEMVLRVRELVRSSFAEGALRADREGRLAKEHVTALHDVGFSRALLPTSVGGGGMSAAAIVRCMAEIANVDPSTAVAFNMHIVLAQYLSALPFPALGPIFADVVDTGATFCGAASLPSSEIDARKSGFRCRREGDDFVVDGKVGFASGSDAAKYTIVLASLLDDDEDSVVVAFPSLDRAGIEVLANWDAMGLRGTASNDIVCNGLRLHADEAMVLPAAFISADNPVPIEVVERRNVSLASLLGCWMGMCEGTLDLLVEFAGRRYGYIAVRSRATSATYRADEPWVRNRLGHMAYLLETGRALLRHFCDVLDRGASDEEHINETFALAVYHWKLTLDEFVIGATKVGGAHGYVKSGLLERFVRDLIGCNVMTWRTDDLPRSLALPLFGERIVLPGLAGT